VPAGLVGTFAQLPTVRRNRVLGQRHPMRVASLFQMSIPARQAFFAIADIGFAHHFVYRIAHGDSFLTHAAFAIGQFQCEGGFHFDVIFVFDFVGAALQSICEVRRGVGRRISAKQIQR